MSSIGFWVSAGVVALGSVALSVSCGEEAPPVTPPSSGGMGGTGGGGGAQPIAGVVSESSASVAETDPQITVKGANIVIVWTGRTAGGSHHVGYTVSTDGGASFSEPTAIQPPEGMVFESADVVIDAGDTAHVAFVGFSRTGEGADIYFTSFDLGSAAGAPENVTDPMDMGIGFFGRPRMAFTNGGRLMVTHTETIDQQAELVVHSKLPTEDMWTRQQLQQGANNYSFQYPCSANLSMMGQTYITAVHGGRLVLYRTGDEGMTWQGIEAQDINEGGAVRGPVTCVADEQNVWITYGIAGQDGLSRIRTAMSQDGGGSIMLWGTITDPEIKPKFALNATTLQQPDVVHAVYYNGAGAGDLSGSFLRSRFQPADLMQIPPMMPDDPEPGLPGLLIQEPVVFQNDENHMQWLGNGVGLRYQGNTLYVAHVDNASGESHVAFQAIAQ